MLLRGRCAAPAARPARQPAARRPVVRPVVPAAAATTDPGAASTSGRAPAPALSRRAPPSSIHEVSNGNILGFGADLSEDHPGFHDEAYKRRRVAIAQLAAQHRIGEPIPRIDYTPEERAVWAHVMRELSELLPRHACARYVQSWPKFGFREDEVPQLEDVGRVLQRETGWTIRPVAGLMHPRDFLNGLAFKYFHSTQYMRHPSKPSYTPEPDVVHELLGHVPMLADPVFADMVQTIGLASLGADEKQIWHLTKVYWYTVEFGVVRERAVSGQDAAVKAFGAGILSSFGELQHMARGGAELASFDPFAPQPKMSYKDGFQKRYFVMESFEVATHKLCDFARTMALPEELRGAVYPRG